MLPTAYLLLINSSRQLTIENTVLIWNTAGWGKALYGSSTDHGSQALWLILKPKNNITTITETLRQIPGFIDCWIVSLSLPVESSQVTSIRDLFEKLHWDAKAVSDDQIATFYTEEIQGTQKNYIDFMGLPRAKKIAIKPLTGHPKFTPEWLTAQEALQNALQDLLLTNKEFTVDNIKTISIRVVEDVEVVSINPPPPPMRK